MFILLYSWFAFADSNAAQLLLRIHAGREISEKLWDSLLHIQPD